MALRTAGGNSAYHNFHNDYLYIVDPKERRRLALSEIDTASFGWYHVRTIIVTGMGFFTDAYDIFAIGLVTQMLGTVYYDGKLPGSSETAIKIATSGGNVIGQIAFGWLADIVGRKRMYGLELIIIIFATVAQALSSNSAAVSIVGVTIFWRIMMGIGIGGDYPLSAVIVSEFASTRWRGSIIGSVFAMQGLGQFGAAIVSLMATVGYKHALLPASGYEDCTGECKRAVDTIWRIVIGFGAVPGFLALYYRLTIPETPRYTFDVSRDIVQGGSDIRAFLSGHRRGIPEPLERIRDKRLSALSFDLPQASWRDFWKYNAQWKNGKILLGTAGSWFFLDVAFYGVSLNNTTFLHAIGYSTGSNLYKDFYNSSVGNMIIVCAGAIPGYWMTVALVDRLGRKPIQLLGFAMVLVTMCIMGFGYHALGDIGLMACYVVAQFFFNFGPNATTFIIPGEVFPTRYRSTSYGISAAAGKIGAIVAQCAIAPLKSRGATPSDSSPWLNHVIEIFALFMLFGIFTTILLPETKRKTLEELAQEEPNGRPHPNDNESVITGQ
ncbi:hypothetical protein M433DRAFT_152974 [Acidomyces richmondensis BFW]|nr:MAG: hypothetical protein FE78DRAFT_88613 [Acidomyces sp. 'richmondensis']KYG46777.1 hypothetical protein M433DRAFT_152974 [Acidomyces richmondensis BFW]